MEFSIPPMRNNRSQLRLLYLANMRLPTERAHGIQIMNTCSALAATGAGVMLVVPTRHNNITEEPFEYYGLAKNFSIKRLTCPDTTRYGTIGNIFQSFMFSLLTFLFVLQEKRKYDVIYSRHESLLLLPSLVFNKPVFWESHAGKVSFIARIVLRRMAGLVTITSGGRDFYVAQGISSERILVAHDGVDLEKFVVRESKEECRKKFNLPLDKKIVAYTGSIALYEWKGVNVLLEAARLSNDADILFLFVGGNKDETGRMKKRYLSANILFISKRPYPEVPYYLKAADVLVLPNKKGNEISEKFTSPMKLFEYMASGTPIVASNLPSLKEILSEEMAMFFEPNDPGDLLRAIEETFGDCRSAEERAGRAVADVSRYSWRMRAGAIQEHILWYSGM